MLSYSTMGKNPKLTFSPTIYRDWTVIFSTLAYQGFTLEFARQFNFRYTDTMYVWDGRIVTIYRAIEEHRDQMFKLLQTRLSENSHFIEEVTTNNIRNLNALHYFYLGILQQDFSRLKKEKLQQLFATYCKHVAAAIPCAAITMYFPQQVEFLGLRQQYQREFDLGLETRARVHHILTPIGNMIARKFADDALRRMKIPRELASYLTITELQEYWNKLNHHRGLEKRLSQRQRYWMLAAEGITQESIKKYVQRHHWDLQIPRVHHHREIKGQTVYSAGKVTGLVRVVPNRSAFTNVQKNDIVVAPSTSPEYSSILSKAKGIVTDEGGITSHTAILSREMGIPAIVGTAIASRVLKDGDEVEMDTDRGIVQVTSLAH